MERVLDDAADELWREDVGEFWGKRRGDGVEVVALVSLEAAGGPDFSYVRNIISRGESCAGAVARRRCRALVAKRRRPRCVRPRGYLGLLPWIFR